MSAEEKATQLVHELNTFAEEKFKNQQFVEAEERFRAALDVYKNWAKQSANSHTAALSTITGLVKALEAQGKRMEAASVLKGEEQTISEIINMLRREIQA